MANWTPIKVYNTDKFKEWRDKFNVILDYLEVNDIEIENLKATINNNYFEAYVKDALPLRTNTPIEIKQITVQDGFEWYLETENFALYGLKLELVLIWETIFERNPNRTLVYGDDWYVNDDGKIVVNTPLLAGDKVSVRTYGLIDGKQWTDFYAHKITYQLSQLDYIVDNAGGTTDILFPYVFDPNYASVFLNGVLLSESDYTISVGRVIVNSILSDTDVISVETNMRLIDIIKYQSYIGITRDDADSIKRILDTEPMIVYQWSVDNASEILDPAITVPTLTETELMSRTIEVGLPALTTLNV